MSRAALLRAVRRVPGAVLLGTASLLMLAVVARSQGAAEDLRHPARDGDGFLLTLPGRPLELPADHASHPETRTEWWYLTGPLRGPQGEAFAFQATWFRRALLRDVPAGRSPLAVREVLLFHGVLRDLQEGTAHVSEQASRAFAPWASAASDRLAVAVLGQRIEDEAGDGRLALLDVRPGGARVRLELALEDSPLLRHGREPGLSLKGEAPGQASWYYSLPRVAARGEVTLPDGRRLPVDGQLWLDHEFGSMGLGADQVGWDWFSVALDDGSDLMLYQLRRATGGAAGTSAGTLRRPDGQVEHLGSEAFVIEPRGSWSSPDSGARYPSGWTLRIPTEDLELQVTPVVVDQEVRTPRSTGVTYWEGLCRFSGRHRGLSVAGEGFVELVGYDAPITGRFEPRR